MTSDVVIVGNGMAGLVLSYLLKQHGINHVILDRKTKIKHFALGETLPPSALPLLQSIGLLQLFEKYSVRKIYGYHSCWGSDRLIDNNFYFHRPFKYGLKIKKELLLEQLVQINSTKCFQYDRHLKLQIENEGVKIIFNQDGQSNNLFSKLVIDATGRNRRVLKLLRIPIVDYDSNLSFSCHLPKKEHPKIKHDVLVESFNQGWGLMSGLGESLNVVTIFTIPKSPVFKISSNYNKWKTILKHTVYLKHFLADNTDYRVIGKPANSSMPQTTAGKNWLAIGDAALAFDPLCSHGITNAIYTALKASEAIQLWLANSSNENSTNQGNLFIEYNSSLNEIFKAYLKSKHNIYKSESRWKDEAYWLALHDKNVKN